MSLLRGWTVNLTGIACFCGCTAPPLPSTFDTPGFSHVAEAETRQVVKSDKPLRTHDLSSDQSAELCIATAKSLKQAGDAELASGHPDKAANHFEKASAQFERALEHQPKMVKLHKEIANLEAKSGNYQKAIQHYEKAIATSPKDADMLNDLGYCYFKQQKFEEAEKYLKQSLQVNSKSARAHVNLGMALARQNRIRESLEEFKKGGSVASAHANLAAMYHEMNRIDDARSECLVALRLDAQHAQARELLANLDSAAKEPISQTKFETTDPTSIKLNASGTAPTGISLQKPIRGTVPRDLSKNDRPGSLLMLPEKKE